MLSYTNLLSTVPLRVFSVLYNIVVYTSRGDLMNNKLSLPTCSVEPQTSTKQTCWLDKAYSNLLWAVRRSSREWTTRKGGSVLPAVLLSTAPSTPLLTNSTPQIPRTSARAACILLLDVPKWLSKLVNAKDINRKLEYEIDFTWMFYETYQIWCKRQWFWPLDTKSRGLSRLEQNNTPLSENNDSRP